MRKLVFFSFFILWIPVCVQAQWDKYAPTGIRVGADVGNFGYSLLDDGRDFWEFSADVDIYRYYITTDYGYTKFMSNKDTYNYESTGRYFRVGPEVNFIKNQTSDVLFFGIKYGTSTFDEDISYLTINAIEQNEVWPVNELETSNENLSASWFEFNTGLKARIIDNVYLGFTVRYKFLPNVNGGETFTPYFVPGFGKKVDNDAWGLSYYISYRIPFRKKKKNYFKEAQEERNKKQQQQRQQQQRQNEQPSNGRGTIRPNSF